MGIIGLLREYNSRLDSWLRMHPVLWFGVLAISVSVISTGSYLGIADRPFVEALGLGIAFGITFAVVTTVLQTYTQK
ncbi:hypothetical protein DMJ13_22315 [halophilic archaeon]|nr:hypothetical protein DMJ13_22315 [halophilic archaeon]